MKRTGHIPSRRCVACGKIASQGEMLRIVRMAEGEGESFDVAIDATGKAPGRGAYVCSSACLERACKTHALDKALRMRIRTDAYDRIREQGETLL